MFTNFLVYFQDLLSYFIVQTFILYFFDCLVPEQIAIELLKHGEEGLSQFKQSFADFGPGEDVDPECWSLLGQLVTLVCLVAAHEAVVDDIANDLVFCEELTLVGSEHVGPGFCFCDFFKGVG